MTWLDEEIDQAARELAAGCRVACERVIVEAGIREDDLERWAEWLEAQDRMNFEQTRDLIRACLAALEE